MFHRIYPWRTTAYTYGTSESQKYATLESLRPLSEQADASQLFVVFIGRSAAIELDRIIYTLPDPTLHSVISNGIFDFSLTFSPGRPISHQLFSFRESKIEFQRFETKGDIKFLSQIRDSSKIDELQFCFLGLLWSPLYRL